MNKFKNFKQNDTENVSKVPLTKAIKNDIIKLLWIIIYASVILLALMIIISFTPAICAYAYSSIGAILGVNFSSISVVDVAFWGLCSLTTGAIIVPFVVMGLKKLLNKWTYVIITKHVTNKKVKGVNSDNGLSN